MSSAGLDAFVERQEILSWWSQERGRVTDECRVADVRIRDRALEASAALTTRQLLLPSTERKEIERRIESDINMFQARIAKSLDEACAASMERVEGQSRFGETGIEDAAMLTAGGAFAVGSVGMAAMATGAATTVTATSILGVFTTGTVVAFSWPIFGAFAVSAFALGAMSPKFGQMAYQNRLRKFQRHIERNVRQALVESGPKSTGKSLCEDLLDRLDQARDQRLEGLT